MSWPDFMNSTAVDVRCKGEKLEQQGKTENVAAVLCACAVSAVISSNIHVAVDDMNRWKNMADQQIACAEIFSAALARAQALHSALPPTAHDEIATLRQIVSFYDILIEIDADWNSEVSDALGRIKYGERKSKWPKLLLAEVRSMAVSKNATNAKQQVTELIEIFQSSANLEEAVLHLFHAERSAFLDFMDKWTRVCEKRVMEEKKTLNSEIASLQTSVDKLTLSVGDASHAIDTTDDLRKSADDRLCELQDELGEKTRLLGQKQSKLNGLQQPRCPCLATRERRAIVSYYSLCDWCRDYFAPFGFSIVSFKPFQGRAKV